MLTKDFAEVIKIMLANDVALAQGVVEATDEIERERQEYQVLLAANPNFC